MLKDLTYKKKNLYLAVLSLSFLLIVYFSALNKTFSLYKENDRLKNKLGESKGAANNLNNLQNKLNTFNQYISNYIIDSTKSPQYAMEVVSDLCRKHHITLLSFPRADLVNQNDFLIETSEIEAQGTFINLLYLIYELEQKNKIGRVSSVNFKSYIDNKNKKTNLTLTIYLQSIKLSPHETKF